MPLTKRLGAECLGTFSLVLGGCGAAVLSAAFPNFGIGFVGVALAFGLAQLTMCYTIGHISGAHINPAVTIGLATGGRFPWREVMPYIIAQVVGAIIASAVLYEIASGISSFSLAGGFASDGYGAHSPGGYDLHACFICEVAMTFLFVFIVLGATDRLAASGFAGVAIGMGLALVHLISIPVTNTSVNPARSTGPALFAGGWAIHQLWLFWLAPIIGGLIAGVVYPRITEARASAPVSA
jgi:aquaporin Z